MGSSLLREHVLEAEQRDALDLFAGGLEFNAAAVADARLEFRQDLLLGLALHRDDEWKAEGGDVGGVELGKQFAFLVG